MEDFQYIVGRTEQDPICFGSKVSRDTNPIGKGLSGFQKRYATEIHTNITPQTYHLKSGLEELQNKVGSKKGVGGLANRAPRFPRKARVRMPSPTRYNPQRRRRKKKVRRKKIPFGKKVPREAPDTSITPGPGYYDVKFPSCGRTKMADNFGRPKMVPAVEEICVAVPSDKCDLCGVVCQYDYWHMNYTQFLCNKCKEVEKILREHHTLKQLRQYKKIRTCTHRHSHEGVNAAVWILPKSKLDKRERLENYLNLYLGPF